MKKVLLASTALVGFAGAAAAEVSLSGYAEIGVFGGDASAVVDGDLIELESITFHNDIDVTFSLSGTTDNGLEFGATIDLDELNGDDISAAAGGNGCGSTSDTSGPSSHNPGCENDSSVWVSGSFGKITLGDTDGALDWAVSEIYAGTSLADDHSTHAGAYWNTGLDGAIDGQVARYEYSFGDFGVAVSAEVGNAIVNGVDSDDALGIGVKWAGSMGGGDLSAGLGYQNAGDLDVTALSLGYAMANGFSVNFGYADGDLFATGSGEASDSWMGLAAAYTTGALTVGINWGTFDHTDGSDQDGWGLVANYDLGGGAVAMFGYGDGDVGSSNGHGESTWSAGLGLSF